MVLPILVAMTVGLVWALSLGVAQFRTVDAARETARALARGEPQAVAVALGRTVAPDGADITVTSTEETITVRVSARSSGPGGLWSAVGSPRLEAEAVARPEGAP